MAPALTTLPCPAFSRLPLTVRSLFPSRTQLPAPSLTPQAGWEGRISQPVYLCLLCRKVRVSLAASLQGFQLHFCWLFGAQISYDFLPYLTALSPAFNEIVVGLVTLSLGSYECHLLTSALSVVPS